MYDHRRLEGRRKVLRWMLDNIGFRFLVKIDSVEGREHFPMVGPAIVMINHIAFVDPIVVLGRLPRNVVPLAKAEVYDYPLVGIFPKIWDVIPVHRGEVDRKAIRSALSVLRAGEVILMAPEGTRNPTLARGKEGLAYLAHHSDAPVVPVAIHGTQGFPSLSLARWRQPGAQITIGRPFRFKRQARRPDRAALRRMTDEAMYVLAAMLPPELRGVYSDLGKATQETLEFV